METLENLIERWLLSKRVTLWGGQYTLTADDTRRQAAAWLVSELEAFQAWLESGSDDGSDPAPTVAASDGWDVT